MNRHLGTLIISALLLSPFSLVAQDSNRTYRLEDGTSLSKAQVDSLSKVYNDQLKWEYIREDGKTVAIISLPENNQNKHSSSFTFTDSNMDSKSDIEVVIDYSWSIDVYEEFTRYIKWGEFQRIQANDEEILLALRKSLKQCINSNKTEMRASTGYENLWGKMRKSEWEKIYLNNYPHPKNLEDL